MQAFVSLHTAADYIDSVIEEAEAAAPSLRRHIKIALPRLDIDVHGFDGTLADGIERHFVARAEPEWGPETGRFTTLIVHAGMAGISPPMPWEPGEYWPHLIFEELARSGLRACHFHDLLHWHMYDFKKGVAVQLLKEPEAFPPWEPGAPLRPILHWHYALQGLRLTHCGTLGVDGRGVLLAGASGAGKSGTVVAGLLNGLQSVGDDYVLLSPGETITARPIFRTLKQDPQGFKRLCLAERLAEPPLNWQGKHQFTIDQVSDLPIPAALSIAALLVPRIAESERTEIVSMSKRDAMLALAPSPISQMPGERESGFRFFSAVANQLPSYWLNLGTRPAEIADVIGNFIAKGGG